MNHQQFEALKTAGDVTAAGLTVGVLASALPPMAALATIIWTGFRIFEMVTGRPFSECRLARWLNNLLKH